MSELTDRIDDAFTRPDFEDAIRLVKAAVTYELKGLDSGLGVEHTRFFNHAIYPDFVLHWHERGAARERPLFLRFEVAEGTVGQDLRLHGDKDPMLIGLLDHREEVQEPEGIEESEVIELHEPEPSPGGALLAEASAIDVLEDFARERPNQVIATSAIARTGHGRLSAETAQELGEALGAGFRAASEARNPELVLDAFGQLEDLVSAGQAEQLATHLQLLWLGSGGELGDLFGEQRLQVDSLSDLQLRELLDYLLTREQPPPVATLRRFAAAVDPDKLGRLFRNFEGGHLGALVEANIPQWTTKWVQVLEAAGPVGWRLDDELLRLSLGDVQLTFTSRGRKLARSSDGPPVARNQFTGRLGDDQPVALDMVSEEAEVELRRRRGADPDVKLRPDQIDALGELASYVLRGRVLSHTVLSPGAAPEGMEVTVDYARRLCAFGDDVSLARALRFAERYFDLRAATTKAGAIRRG